MSETTREERGERERERLSHKNKLQEFKLHSTKEMKISNGEDDSGDEQRTVVVGIKMDAESRELLTWALVKVARPGDRVIALHAISGSDFDRNPLVDPLSGSNGRKKIRF